MKLCVICKAAPVRTVHGKHSNFCQECYVNNGIIQNKIKIKRNDPCPCGSGQKYKRCCR